MNADFWHARWESGRVGFHQDEVNRYLERYWDALDVSKDATVLVPLCGKSRDMVWLRERGHRVVGVELSPIAVRDFFAENGLEATQTNQGAFERWEGDGFVLLCGDFFAVAEAHLEGATAVYDRAALIAFPPEDRKRYVDRLRALLPLGGQSLLVTIAYPQDQHGGPPFSVSDEEVRELFADGFEIEQLASEDVLAENGRFTGRVDCLYENAYGLARTVNGVG